MAGLPKISDPRILVGFESSDDACVYKLTDDIAIINTVDFFPPIVDDPYMFGQIAAANALSDVYAMGGQPKLAMNLLTFPNGKLPLDAVKGILEGGNDKVCEAGATIVGGHSIDDKILQEAKEKLACHIEPPKPKAPDFVDSTGKVLLTQMTTAGG